MSKVRIFSSVIFLVLSAQLFAQFKTTTSWSYDATKTEVQIGDEIELIFKANIINDWYLYSSDIGEDVGPLPTEITFEENDSFEKIGGLIPINAKKKYDNIWEAEVTYFTSKAEFRQRIKVLKKGLDIQGELSFQTCTDVTGQCIPGFEDVNFDFIKVVERKTPIQSSINRQGHAQWTFETPNAEVKTGDEIELVLKAKIDKDWYLYSSDIEEGGPIPAEIMFESNDTFEVIGDLVPVNPKKKYDETFEMDVTYFHDYAEFRQKIRVLKANLGVQGEVTYQTCSDITNLCVLGSTDLMFDFNSVKGNDVVTSTDYSDLLEAEGGESLWGFFIAAFIFGLAALLTPCVFPMIPMTVAFFTNSSQSKRQAQIKATTYGLSIIAIYILVGLIFTSFFGVGLANDLATGAIANIIFFVVFLVFAISFFGFFEINLPTGFVNKMDKNANKGGFIGVFFMAFTLVLVSFSCTGPIVGTVLIESFQGAKIKPLVGMLGFSSAFAIPFTVFAFFPGMLKDLPKSGGWLNSVKVVLGFIELALGFKFLSVADQAYHWGLLDREVYLAIWFVLAVGLALYLFRIIRFPHDSKERKFHPVRFGVAIAALAFAVYLFLGFTGAPLNGLAGYLPPDKKTDFSFAVSLGLSETESFEVAPIGYKGEIKYSDFLELPHDLRGFFDYKQAVAYAQEVRKPIFIDFTGHGCVNCRKMEQFVWSDPQVLERLREDYVVLALYVDDKTELPESEWYTSEFDGKVKKTVGKQNFDFQITQFNGNAQPYYVLLDINQQPLVAPLAYDPSVENFVKFLDEGKDEFAKRVSATALSK